MAKLFGSYKALHGGLAKEAFLALTGFPCQNVQLVGVNFHNSYHLTGTLEIIMSANPIGLYYI